MYHDQAPSSRATRFPTARLGPTAGSVMRTSQIARMRKHPAAGRLIGSEGRSLRYTPVDHLINDFRASDRLARGSGRGLLCQQILRRSSETQVRGRAYAKNEIAKVADLLAPIPAIPNSATVQKQTLSQFPTGSLTTD